MSIVVDHKNTIRAIVAEILEIEPEEMAETSLLKEEYNADSIQAIEILVSVEKAFNVQIPQADLRRMVHLAGVYEVVKEYAGWSE